MLVLGTIDTMIIITMQVAHGLPHDLDQGLLYIYIYIYTHLHLYLHLYIYLSICLSLSIYIGIGIGVCVHIYIYIYVDLSDRKSVRVGKECVR